MAQRYIFIPPSSISFQQRIIMRLFATENFMLNFEFIDILNYVEILTDVVMLHNKHFQK